MSPAPSHALATGSSPYDRPRGRVASGLSSVGSSVGGSAAPSFAGSRELMRALQLLSAAEGCDGEGGAAAAPRAVAAAGPQALLFARGSEDSSVSLDLPVPREPLGGSSTDGEEAVQPWQHAAAAALAAAAAVGYSPSSATNSGGGSLTLSGGLGPRDASSDSLAFPPDLRPTFASAGGASAHSSQGHASLAAAAWPAFAAASPSAGGASSSTFGYAPGPHFNSAPGDGAEAEGPGSAAATSVGTSITAAPAIAPAPGPASTWPRREDGGLGSSPRTAAREDRGLGSSPASRPSHSAIASTPVRVVMFSLLLLLLLLL
jgi:hypothetical protein